VAFYPDGEKLYLPFFWGDFLGTIRSKYSIEQFEEALQKFAHGIPELVPKFDRITVSSQGLRVDLEFNYDLEGNIEKIRVYYSRWKEDPWESESFAFTNTL